MKASPLHVRISNGGASVVPMTQSTTIFICEAFPTGPKKHSAYTHLLEIVDGVGG